MCTVNPCHEGTQVVGNIDFQSTSCFDKLIYLWSPWVLNSPGANDISFTDISWSGLSTLANQQENLNGLRCICDEVTLHKWK
jgi:hypothetical protein